MTTRKTIVITGSGPAGITAAIYCARANINTIVASGRGSQLEGSHCIENFPGFVECISGSELLEKMKEQAKKYGVIFIDENATEFFLEDSFLKDELINRMEKNRISKEFKRESRYEDRVSQEEEASNQTSNQASNQASNQTNNRTINKSRIRCKKAKISSSNKKRIKIGDQWYEADAVIIANGSRAKWLNLPNEEKYRNNGISTCAICDGPLPVFRDKLLYVVGGGDTAAEDALFLTKFARKVRILVRGRKMKATKILQDRLINNDKIEILYDTEVESYFGEEKLEGLILRSGNKYLKARTPGLFVAIGHEPNTEYLKNTGLELDEKGYIITRDFVKTNIEGVFAAGDVHDKEFRQAITAAGFGCMAAITAERWLSIR